MITEIRFSDEFNCAFKRLKKRYRSLPDDVKQLLASLVEDPKQGVELYNGMRKVRINFTSKGKGKRGGGRVMSLNQIKNNILTTNKSSAYDQHAVRLQQHTYNI